MNCWPPCFSSSSSWPSVGKKRRHGCSGPVSSDTVPDWNMWVQVTQTRSFGVWGAHGHAYVCISLQPLLCWSITPKDLLAWLKSLSHDALELRHYVAQWDSWASLITHSPGAGKAAHFRGFEISCSLWALQLCNCRHQSETEHCAGVRSATSWRILSLCVYKCHHQMA